MPRPVPPWSDTAERWERLRDSGRPRRVRWDDERGLIHLEEQLKSPWWVYACIAVYDDRVILVEVRTFPSVERDDYFSLRDEIYESLEPLSANKKMSASDYDRLKAAEQKVPKWGEWRRTKTNLIAAGAGLPGTVLERVRPADLIATAQAESDFVARRFGAGVTVTAALTAGPITPGRRTKSDLYYARLAEEYSSIVNGGGQDSARPIVAMAKRRGWEREKMRDEIKQCRNRQMLPGLAGLADHTGRAFGMLTPRARQILAEQGDDE